MKSKFDLIIELKNSNGNKLPTNILDWKSVLGKNNNPKINALITDKLTNLNASDFPYGKLGATDAICSILTKIAKKNRAERNGSYSW